MRAYIYARLSMVGIFFAVIGAGVEQDTNVIAVLGIVVFPTGVILKVLGVSGKKEALSI